MKATSKKQQIETTYTLTLQMNKAEAYALRAIMANVSGDPAGPRGVAMLLVQELRSLGLKKWPLDLCAAPGGIILPDTWDEWDKMVRRAY